MLTLSRPAIIESDEQRLSREYASARWMYHRLLDFEAEHQRILDAAAEEAAPGIVRLNRIVARLAQRARRAARTTEGQWYPNPRPDLAKRLRDRFAALKIVRNADPRWKAALRWADEEIGETKAVRRRRAQAPERVKRRKTETDEAFQKRFELLTHDETEEHFAAKVAAAPRDTRRGVHYKALYRDRRIYWGTWNALVKNLQQARAAVLKRRKEGLPAELRRPKYRNPITLAADPVGFRVVERGPLWWVVEMRIGTEGEWVRVRAKCGNWHDISPEAKIVTAKLKRYKDGERWGYKLNLTVAVGKPVDQFATTGKVNFDWGHREHGHPNARDGIRVFKWRGDDGATGEILIPAKCRKLLDKIDALKSRVDTIFNARKKSRSLRDRNRYTYRRRLMRSGVRTEEEALWLQWEGKYERQLTKRRNHIQNLRREVYTQEVQALRRRYAIFAFEGESVAQLKQHQKAVQMERRKRANRDLATRYEFVEICERFGAELMVVSARNTTRECPEDGCDGLLPVNGPELLVACPACGVVRDKDEGAARVIMKRATEALEKRAP